MHDSNRPTNRLALEASPYLLQHAHNPVDWYPWGPEALAKAKAERKPILLSVGYSACHWCHVMAHESFENDAIAKQMNDNFVNIKVDREERPDVDEVYQRVTQLLTGHGGWPLTVFLDADARPIYGGTYFAPDNRHSRASFPRVMDAVLDTIRNRPHDADEGARQLVERIQMFDQVESGAAVPPRALLETATLALMERYDKVHGGFGKSPKFPMTSEHEMLLAVYRGTGDKEVLSMVTTTLHKMAAGGIYDQLGGGFHRYSVDPWWLVPHFEKMLYDNALLPRLYLEAYRLTKEPIFARVVRETLGYIEREMLAPEGGFYSSQDADTEGVEGKFFVWTPAEVQALLGAERAARFSEVYDVTAHGNWEHQNILRVVADPAAIAKKHHMAPDVLDAQLKEDRQILLAARDKRIKPGRDDKRITAWNGLALSVFAQAGSLLRHEPYLQIARRNAAFLLDIMFDGAILKRIYQGSAKIDGFLDDYAYAAAGLLDLHRATGEARWFEGAQKLIDKILASFIDKQGVLYLTSAEGEALPSRPKSGYDQMLPSPAAITIHSLWRLYVLTADTKYSQAVERSLVAYASEMDRAPTAYAPTAYAAMLSALDFRYRGETVAVISGPQGSREVDELAATARLLLPHDEAVLLANQPNGIANHLVEGKKAPGDRPAAFVCQGYACMPAAFTPEELAERLRRP